MRTASSDQTAKSLRALRRGLSRADTFALFIAVCNSPAQSRRAIEELQRSLPDSPLPVVTLERGVVDPLEEILRQLGDRPPGPVMVLGLEQAIPSDDPQSPVLQALNLRRSEWPILLPRPIVLWIPEYLLGILGRQAPDFLDWRSDTRFFPTLDEAELRPLLAESWRGGADGSLPAEQRRQRIEELESRLATYADSDDVTVQASRADWLSELGNHWDVLGEWDRAEQLHRQALEIHEKLERPERVAVDLGNLGVIIQRRGDLEQAERLHRQALEMNEKLGRWDYVLADFSNLGAVHHMRGDLEQAEQMYRRSLELSENLGRPENVAINLNNLGVIYKTRGDFEQAEQMYRRSLDLNEQLGRKENFASSLSNLGKIYETRGDLQQAEEMYRQSLKINEDLGQLDGIAEDCGALGTVYLLRGDLKEAERMYRRSLDLHEKLGRTEQVAANLLNNLGVISRMRGDLGQAEQWYRRSLEINEQRGQKESIADNYANLGEIAELRGDHATARELWRKARTLYIDLGAGDAAQEMQTWLDQLTSAASAAGK